MAQLKDLLVNGSARVIGSLFANLSGNVLNFGVCSTAAATAAKTVTTNGTFELITGSKILVLFSETDSSNAPTLNVNGTGAKSIKINASDGIGKGFLAAQQYYWFIYDGTNWRTAGAGITQIIPTQYGGTGNSSFTANRIIYSNTATKLASGTIITDGSYFEFTNPKQFLRWTTSSTDNNSTGRSWYGMGTYSNTDDSNYNWFNISNYWGINITTRGNTYLRHNNHIIPHTNNTSGTIGSSTQPVYINAGVVSTTTYSLSATVSAGTANRMAYYSGANTVAAASITSDGAYLGSVSYLSVNTAHQTTYRAYLNGEVAINGNLHFPETAGYIAWDGSQYRQRLYITDDSATDTAVFTFQQSTNSGSSYGDLLVIRDNGRIVLNTNTGGIYKYYSDNSTEAALQINSNNKDVSVIRIDGDNPTGVRSSQAYGFNLKYMGTGGGADNTLRLIADNSGGTDVIAMDWSNDGKVGIGAAYNTNYRLNVNGAGLINNNLTVGTSNAGGFGLAQTNGTGLGISLYGGPKATMPEYGIAFAKTATFGTHGAVTSDWATYFTMSDTTTRGWIFRRGSTNVASIDGTGKLYLGYAASTANPGIYWNPHVESASDASDVSAIYQIKSGVAGGTELRISQANDATDVINIVSPQLIYLNSKKAFKINDTWLRINEDKGFSSGIYTGSSLVRTDNQFQVGDNGNKFYANSSGNGYFSNTLGIAGTNTSYKLYVNGTSYFNNNATFNGHVLPNATNTYNLGSSSLRWKKLYIGTANSYGSNNNNQQPIYWNDGVPSPIGWYFKYCTIASSNKSNYPWHRVATCNLGTGSWVDKDCIIVIRARYNGGFYGMIKISARANNATTNPKGSVDISATWLIRKGLNVDSIRICKKGLSGESNQIDFYVKVGSYARALGYIVEGSNNGWSLINSNEVNDTTVDDKKTSTEVWKDITTSQGATTYDTIVSGVDNTLNGNLAKKLTVQANGTQKGQFNNSADVTVNLGNVVQDLTGANSGNAANINADTFDGMTKQQWLNTIYPIGSIYMSVSATSPAVLFGGKWEQLKDCFLLSAGDTYKSGDKGGEANHILSVDEMPAHSHDRGTMNITGNIWSVLSWQNNGNVTLKAGAFSWTTLANGEYINPDGWSNNNTGTRRPAELVFNAADAWTGRTSSVGSGKAHNNMPPYLAVYMWKRTA